MKEDTLRWVLAQLYLVRDKLEACLPDEKYQNEFVAWLDTEAPFPVKRKHREYDALDGLAMVIIDIKKTLALTIADRKRADHKKLEK